VSIFDHQDPESTLAPAHSRPSPQPTFPEAQAVEQEPIHLQDLLVQHRVATRQLLDAHGRLTHHLARLERPAQLDPVILTPEELIVEVRERVQLPTLSVGLLNPSDPAENPQAATVYWSGIGSATAAAYAHPVPAGKLLVLPVAASVIEVGVDPAKIAAGQQVVCFLMRFFTVQPAYLGG
jgi:hypothetical protein